jgi:hypothetical protein
MELQGGVMDKERLKEAVVTVTEQFMLDDCNTTDSERDALQTLLTLAQEVLDEKWIPSKYWREKESA